MNRLLILSLLLLVSFNSYGICFDLEIIQSGAQVGVCGADIESIRIDIVFTLWVLANVFFGQLLIKNRSSAYLICIFFILSLPLSPIVLTFTYLLKRLNKQYQRLLNQNEVERPSHVLPDVVQTSNPSSEVIPAKHNQLLIGEYRFNCLDNSLSKGERLTYLEPKMMEVLSYLIEHQPRVISLEELHSNVWQNQIVTDTAVRRIISKLRNAFSDIDTKKPQYIKSQMKRGYQLIANVENVTD